MSAPIDRFTSAVWADQREWRKPEDWQAVSPYDKDCHRDTIRTGFSAALDRDEIARTIFASDVESGAAMLGTFERLDSAEQGYYLSNADAVIAHLTGGAE